MAPGAADRRRTAGGPAQSGTISLRGRLCDHSLLWQLAAGTAQCRDGTGRSCAPDLLTDYLETLEQKLHYRHWYFGHYHRDCQLDDKHTLVYYAILPLKQKESVNAVPVPDQTEGEKDHGKG